MRVLLSILLLFLIVDAWATDQDPDVLYFKGNKYFIYTSNSIDSPLESFSGLTERLQKVNKNWMSSGCWRNYTAEWAIEDGELYLIKVKNCKDGSNINFLVEKELNRKFISGKMRADWVNGVFWVGSGLRYWNAFENEIKFIFKEGDLVSTEHYTSPNCTFQNQDTLNKFIYSNINWQDLPNERVQVSLEFEIDTNGKIIRSEVLNNVNIEFKKEAFRVLQMVPCWKVFTRTGEVYSLRDIEIMFSEENRMKYKN